MLFSLFFRLLVLRHPLAQDDLLRSLLDGQYFEIVESVGLGAFQGVFANFSFEFIYVFIFCPARLHWFSFFTLPWPTIWIK